MASFRLTRNDWKSIHAWEDWGRSNGQSFLIVIRDKAAAGTLRPLYADGPRSLESSYAVIDAQPFVVVEKVIPLTES